MPRGKRSAHTRLMAKLELIEIDRLRPHEQIRPALLARLTKRIKRDGYLRRPILVADGDLVILDGHHRVEAIRSLGCKRIPAYLVDYASESVRVTTWPDATVTSVTKEEVIHRGLFGDRFPPKTSRHSVNFALDDRPTDLRDLM